jgi:hypothetical protein
MDLCHFDCEEFSVGAWIGRNLMISVSEAWMLALELVAWIEDTGALWRVIFALALDAREGGVPSGAVRAAVFAGRLG